MRCPNAFPASVIIAIVFVVSLVPLSNATPKKKKRRSIYHDDGITEPYKPPRAQTNYLKTVPKEFLAYFKVAPEALEKWRDAKFGVFMHWDPSCQITGSMSWARKGPRPHHSSDGHVTKGIPEEVYNSQYKTFNPVKFDADKWIKMVKDAGAKYFVFTAKHHNGFCMFDTPTTEYCIRNTPFKRDICKELADACHKYGIMLFWYYSEPDWTEPTYRLDFNSDEYYQKYIKGFLYPQLRQLLTKYGKIDGIWFDGLGLKPQTWRAPEMLKMLRTINPQLIINSRFGSPPMRIGDYDGPENRIGRFQTNRPWETCFRIGGAWGYSKNATPLSFKDAIGLLVRCAGNGGNLLLNTGPSPEGTIQESHIKRYLEMGDWLKKYGESVYATRGGPYTSGPWGCCTRSKNGNDIYLHILADWNGTLSLPNIGAKVVKAECLTGQGNVRTTQRNGRLTLQVSGFNRTQAPADTLIKLALDKRAMNVPIVKSVGPSLTIGSKVTASSSGSCGHQPTAPEALVASAPSEFYDGSYIRAVWRNGSKDKKPWVQFEFAKPAMVDQVTICEGSYGKQSNIKSFSIYLRSNGTWKKVYDGTKIGGSFGVVLDTPVKADAMKIEFYDFHKFVTLNAVNAFSSYGGN